MKPQGSTANTENNPDTAIPYKLLMPLISKHFGQPINYSKGLILFCKGAPIATTKWSDHLEAASITFGTERLFRSGRHCV